VKEEEKTLASIVQEVEDDQMMGEGGGPAFLKEGPDLSGRSNIRRPPAPHINAKEDDFTFMQIDTDYYTTVPPGKFTALSIKIQDMEK
jgi:hypothetical protein